MKWAPWILALLLIVLVTIASPGEEDPIQSEYCPMWEIWHEQKAVGIPIEKRNGWPDQDGRYFEECDQ